MKTIAVDEIKNHGYYQLILFKGGEKNMPQVEIFTKNGCPQCRMSKKVMNEHHIKYIEHNVSEHPEYIETVKNMGYRTLPVIKIKNTNEIWNGFRPDRINAIAMTS